MRPRLSRALAIASAASTLFACAAAPQAQHSNAPKPATGTTQARVIVFVWDGLRPDSIDATLTPRLAALAERGTTFSDHHATYPTFTMMNAASFATGDFPEQTGFYGNTLWQPDASGPDVNGQPLSFVAPVFTEDYWVLDALNQSAHGQLLLSESLFDVARRAGLRTAAIGKAGAAFIQDLGKSDLFLDERVVSPAAFAAALQQRGFALPRSAAASCGVALKIDNGDPTAFGLKQTFDDGVTSNPADTSGTPYHASNRYLMDVFSEGVLPMYAPALSFIWLRNPDSTQHSYGPGSANARDALASQDLLLGTLLERLEQQGPADSTDLLIVSDHAHSSVSGPLDLFPLRRVKPSDSGTGSTWGEAASDGFSVSGTVRLAHLLTLAGFAAYDGAGCVYDPVMTGIDADGSALYTTQIDRDGTRCGTVGQQYTTPSYAIPASGLPDKALVVAANGGSDYLYAPQHDAPTVASVVRWLQSREEFGAIFVAPRYGALPGTMSLDTLHLENSAGRSPDIIVSYNYDEHALVQGVPGTEFQSASGFRGMHGSFSPVDVHNTLIAVGPHFRAGFKDALPSGNVDLAPTVARLLGLSLPTAAGRVLEEALQSGHSSADYRVTSSKLGPNAAASGLIMQRANGATDAGKSSYTFEVELKDLKLADAQYRYFDRATVQRQ
jgi:arylsulfatase A-like enzyme